jgi:hypothetical protein
MSEDRYASEHDRRTEEAERARYDDWASQIEVKIPECYPAEVPDVFECASCGRVAVDMSELLRPCGDSRGEWYCHRGEGCQSKEARARAGVSGEHGT